MSIQLSEPEDYDGGQLEVYIPNQTKNKSFSVEKLSDNLGAGIIFPAFLEHSVSKLKSGMRLSLVVWANGNFWK
jgi:PKHD-type hydroxylase